MHHHRHAVGHGQGFGLIVGHIDESGGKSAMQLRQLAPHVDAQRGIQVGERLVHQEGDGVSDHGPSKGGPLALSTRELTRLARQEVLDLQRFRRAAHLPAQRPVAVPGEKRADKRQPLQPRQVAQLQRRHHVLFDAQVRVERVGLEDHREVAIGRPYGGHVAPVDLHPPAIRSLQTRQDPEQRRLAATGGPHQRDELTGRNREVDTLQNLRGPK